MEFQEDQNYAGSDYNNRVRILEGKYNLTRDRMFLLNENMISQYKSLTEEIDILKEEIKELKETSAALKETAANLLRELDLFARKEHLKVLEKYINMWNPLNYVTKEEVIDLLEKHKKRSSDNAGKKARKSHRKRS